MGLGDILICAILAAGSCILGECTCRMTVHFRILLSILILSYSFADCQKWLLYTNASWREKMKTIRRLEKNIETLKSATNRKANIRQRELTAKEEELKVAKMELSGVQLKGMGASLIIQVLSVSLAGIFLSERTLARLPFTPVSIFGSMFRAGTADYASATSVGYLFFVVAISAILRPFVQRLMGTSKYAPLVGTSSENSMFSDLLKNATK